MTTTTATESTTSQASGLSLLQAVAVGVNTTSPAYSLAAILVPMALLVGYATPIVLIVSFVPMALTSLAFMYLNRQDPDCGTTFSWVSRALGPRSGFIAGWVIAAAGILVLGSLSETAVRYLLLTFGLDGLADNRLVILLAAAILIVAMAGLAIVGSESSARFQTVLTFVQVGILIAFGIGAGVVAVREGLPAFTPEWVNPLDHGMESLIAAMLLGVFAFWGWEAATNLSEECRRPSDAGRAGVLSTIIVLITYSLIAVFVVIYLGKSEFNPVGESGLVLVDMSPVVFGPAAFLVLLAVGTSALASTQTSLVPGSRAVLSMARRGALPARLGLMHPRFKSPWVSLALLGGLAAGWYLAVSSISDVAMIDTLSSLGILVAFYYSLTGFSCIVFYRKHVVSSVKGFLLVGLGPLVGSLGLAFMLAVGIRSVWDPASSASGQPWLGLAPPLAMAAVIFALGVVVLVARQLAGAGFFRNGREVASHAQSPFAPAELPTAPDGIVIDCNASAEAVLAAIASDLPQDARERPVFLVFGVRPSGLLGEEEAAARDALVEDGNAIFRAAERALQRTGVRGVTRVFEDADTRASVESVRERIGASTVVRPSHHGAPPA